ncbi:isochorismate synthase [Sediminivirga luteola]|uniref:isochorismate synthase n=1 Tax=Sediminivirga luteola TaxID=1774748 RepID=A0A8J2XK34_9MICO|nr:isochorismate synthase [Sediminivirga luteola]MCI2265433.1 isochorismate synthase [Sediminivirga luteola]GGA11220.1 isochorismate synthase [Sediminivirga luteola]
MNATSAETGHPARTLLSRTRFIDGISEEVASPFGDDLPTSAQEFLRLLPADGFSCWVRENSGLVGWGELARLTARGPGRFRELQRQWDALLAGAEVTDAVRMEGSGPLAFGSIAFAATSAAESVLVVPRVVLGRRDGRVWMTTMRFAGEPEEASTLPRLRPTPIRPPVSASIREGRLGADAWGALVDQIAPRLGRPGAPDKVVLARDLLVHDEQPFDIRYLLGHLHASYPSCWTFLVDRLLGATPELLVSVSDGAVTSRVLAGTYRSSGDRGRDLHEAKELFTQAKDSDEHRHAVDSLVEALAPLTATLDVDPQPFLLELANVIHLATDAHGRLRAGSDGAVPTALEVAEAVHPTAALGGTPRGAAMEWIERHEEMDRGRYGGPVGWIDARGGGQWGIALRCGELLDESTARVFAGAGIMPQSRGEIEVAETAAKFAPMLGALGAR